MYSVKKQRGFTLLELLVVISIIAILVAVGATSYGTAQKKGRDSKRRGDMKAVQNAFEQYFTKNGLYETDCGDMATPDIMSGGLPGDPKPGWPPAPETPGYSYDCSGVVVGSVTYNYCACAKLENERGNSADGSCGYANAGTETYFCVSDLQ